MTPRILRYPTALVLALIVAACSGDTGPTGPAGPAGPEGPEGPQGPAGNANLLTGSVETTDADWSTGTAQMALNTSTGVTSFGKLARTLDIAIPELTEDVLDGGAFFAWTRPIPDRWVPLPYSFVLVGGVIRVFEIELTPGNLRVYYFLLDADDADANLSPMGTQPTRTFRWAILPPDATSSMETMPSSDDPWIFTEEMRARGFRISGGF